MSFNVSGVSISNITSQMELAERLAGQAEAPQEALKSLFDGCMLALEKHKEIHIESSAKERIWNQVSVGKLKILKETFFHEFCDRILGSFKENEVEEMLQEHKRTGFVKDPLYTAHLSVAYHFYKENILNAVTQKAESMKTAWIPEIVDAVENCV